jgi:hypothetical protein
MTNIDLAKTTPIELEIARRGANYSVAASSVVGHVRSAGAEIGSPLI